MEALPMESLEKAMQWAKDNHPTASIQHKAAFANSVAYYVAGASGGFGGPSLREHLCSWKLAGASGIAGAVSIADEAITMIQPDGSLRTAGGWAFEEAIAFCEPLCFCEASVFKSLLVQIQGREHCFDDDPQDLEVLRGKFA
jgi:hypothetical protein